MPNEHGEPQPSPTDLDLRATIEGKKGYHPGLPTVPEHGELQVTAADLDLEAILEEQNVSRPGLSTVHERGGLQVCSLDLDLEVVEAKIEKLKKQMTSPCKSFTWLRGKSPAIKKLVTARDHDINQHNSDEDSDSSTHESDSPGPISRSQTTVYSKIKPHGPAYFAAIAAELEVDTLLAEEKQAALCAKAKALNQAGKSTTFAGFRYILDDGRSLDVELSYPASLPPAKGPPKRAMRTELEGPSIRSVDKAENVISDGGSHDMAYKPALEKDKEPELCNTEDRAVKDQKLNEEPNEKHQATYQFEVPSSAAVELASSTVEQVIKEGGEGKKEYTKKLVDEGVLLKGGFCKEEKENDVASVVYSDSEYSQEDG